MMPPLVQHVVDVFRKLLGRPLAEVLPPQCGQGPITLKPGDEQTIFDTNGHFYQGELLGVTLGIKPLGDGFVKPDGFLPAVKARVEWRLGNAWFSAECDWMNGTTIAVVAERVRIDAVYERSYLVTDRDGGKGGPCFEVSAGAGYGNLARPSSSAKRTIVVNAAAGNDVKTIEIPPFATSFAVVPVGQSPQTVTADVYGLGDANPVRYLVQGLLSNQGQSDAAQNFPLFNGARYIDIAVPTALTDPAAVLVIFDLAL